MRPLLLINLLGSVYGYYWYRFQLAATPLYAWPFVPDSPLATTLFALALLVPPDARYGRPLRAAACAVCIKYGLWAMVVIGHYWWLGGRLTPTEAMLWLSHLGMAVQGLIFLLPLRPGTVTVTVVGLWLVLNDVLDYAAGLHPYLFAPGQELTAGLTAALLSGGLLLLLRGLRRPVSPGRP